MNSINWTAVGAIATGIMAIATFVTIIQNQIQMKELSRPRLIFSIISSDGFYCLKIHNVGSLPAYGIRLEINKEFIDCLYAKYFQDVFRSIQSHEFSLDSHEYRFFPISCWENGSAHYIPGELAPITDAVIKGWKQAHKDTSIIISGKYCKKYRIHQELKVSNAMTDSIFLENHEERTLDKISNSMSSIAKSIEELYNEKKRH